jgi:hypothetical protein
LYNVFHFVFTKDTQKRSDCLALCVVKFSKNRPIVLLSLSIG